MKKQITRFALIGSLLTLLAVLNIANMCNCIPYGEESLTLKVSAKTVDKDFEQERETVNQLTVIEVEHDDIIIGSIEMKNNSGIILQTDSVLVDTDALTTAYYAHYDTYDWDYKNKIREIEVLWEFLVNQQGMNPVNAAAILGNVAHEGYFGQQQGTNYYIANIDDATYLLNNLDCGFGVAQWTFSTRRQSLLAYYNMSSALIDDWNIARVVAECCMLYEEVKAFDIFEDINIATSIEDSCGRVALLYESYNGSSEQWGYNGNEYFLKSTSGSGYNRLQYSIDIYEHFMGD